MRLTTAILFFMPVFSSCQEKKSLPASFASIKEPVNVNETNPYPNIESIPLPAGYLRVPVAPHSFGAWLRQQVLKPVRTVFLYNGQPKKNQTAQFAVLDISTGKKDLQQCADAVMRCRAEWLYQENRMEEIDFSDNEQNHYRLNTPATRPAFNAYLEKVFLFCGTLSLSNELGFVKDFNAIKAGDVFIKGGSPGHAMLVMDIAINSKGKKIFLLAQSYMPAQDIHIVVNPLKKEISPWYEVNENPEIETPEWVFKRRQLKEWIGKY